MSNTPPISLDPFSLDYDDRALAHRVGLVVLATDHTIEADFRRIFPEQGVGIHVNRIANENPCTPDNLRRMEPRLTEATALILPGESLDVVCYGCTSASTVIGDDPVRAAIQAAKPGVPVVNPALAGRQAIAAFGARRISLLVPYVRETGEQVRRYFTDHGIQVDRLTCLEVEDDTVIARVGGDTIRHAARAALDPASEALFLSCTALRAVPLIAELEAELGVPVVSSNQASAWLTLSHIGQPGRPGHGRLMERPAPI